MLGDSNVCSTIWLLDFHPVDESTKLRSVYGGLANERNIDVPKTRSIDPGYETVQVLASSSIFEAGESRENNAFP